MANETAVKEGTKRTHRKQDIRIEIYHEDDSVWRECVLNNVNKATIVDAASAWRYVRDDCAPGRYRVIDVKGERTLAEESKPVRKLT